MFLEGYLAKCLPVDVYGSYQYYLNISLIIAVVLNVIPAEVIIPKISRNHTLSWAIIFVVFLARFTILLTFISLSSILYFNGIKTFSVVILFTTALLFTEAVSVVVNYYQAIVQAKYISIVRLLALCFRAFVVLSVSIESLSIDFIAWVRIIESIILGLLLYSLINRNAKLNRNVKHYNAIFKVIINNGLKIWPSVIIYYLLIRFDRLAVGYFFDMNYVAYYSVAQQVLDQVSVLLVIIAGSIFPLFVYRRKKYLEQLNGFGISASILIALSVVGIIFTFIFSEMFITYIYGERYAASLPILSVMIFALPFTILDYSFSQYFISINKPLLVFIKNMVGLSSGLILYVSFGDVLNIEQFPIILISINIILLITSLIILAINHAKYKINN